MDTIRKRLQTGGAKRLRLRVSLTFVQVWGLNAVYEPVYCVLREGSKQQRSRVVLSDEFGDATFDEDIEFDSIFAYQEHEEGSGKRFHAKNALLQVVCSQNKR